MDEEHPSTEELRIAQAEREQAESETAEHAILPEERHAAERRADKASYLREKVEEQQAADGDTEH